MTTYKSIVTFFSLFLLVNCTTKTAEDTYGFSLTTTAENNTMTLGDSFEMVINNPSSRPIAKVTYKLDDEIVDKSLRITSGKLGKRKISATILHDAIETTVEGYIKILNNKAPDIYTFEIINTYPHDISSYTQGLEFYKGELYESTGQYNESKLRKIDYKTGDVLKNLDLSNGFFGEGLSILDNTIYQLTWQEDTGLIYDLNSFEKKGVFRYDLSKEGWGLCNDGQQLYKSDGTEKIWTLNTETFTEDDYIEVYTNKGKIPSLNELEWINGKIYANIYQRNGVAIIEPSTGAVDGVIDFTPLKDLVTQHEGLDVLNGIAYNPETETLFVTGKRWDKLFEVAIAKKP